MSGNADREYVIRGPQSFGMALREFRLRRGLTQAELAKTSGLHRSYLSELERGSTTDAVRYLVLACRALDLEIVLRPREGARKNGA
ncbi:helix-turn-helix domain-containing protein [Ferrimicrobium acidiphilum]|uniref:Anaerobic benzoate catabolism transcriptional regulator n=1 Tax=Ferrimicrobium acidiphilum DSM 19497 TaxID=1121877 RepID=A0A0D8FU84_9ACTN|nr:helix-turn-helix transcriptional regulator [Ferrimicrobium acidiphilum]KJE76691.1 anaerobic benzoate catabolism transcriptional regulator [Ferrimicrobium acidiphilum DSM 19497]MCL5053397.1 helix-turn-helix transcriptional regulator [Gammaproteobacteria bacterium]